MRTANLTLVLAALSALSCGNSGGPTARPDVAGSRPPPPPERPSDVIAEAHFARPRTTVSTAGRMLGTRIPFELGLALYVGLDSTVLSAADTARPMDVVVTGDAEHPVYVLVMTPQSNGQLRSHLAGRYRFVPVPGLGERLDPRDGRSSDDTMRCALVGTPGPIATRIVCAGTTDALAHAGRYAAYAAERRAEDSSDALLDLDGAQARRVLVPELRDLLQEASRGLGESAAEQRRSHTRPPDFGDPEAIVAMVNDLARDVEGYGADLRHVVLRANVSSAEIALDAETALDPEGRSGLARDARARVGAASEHPLAGRLSPDAFAVLATRADAAARVTTMNNLVGAALRVMGERVPSPDRVRTALEALFSHVGDEGAYGLAREGGGAGVEWTALWSTTDGGASARAALGDIGHAEWLARVRFGETPLLATYTNDQLLLRMGPAAPTPGAARPGTTRPASPARPRASGTGARSDAGVAATSSGTGAGAGGTTVASAPELPRTAVIAVVGDVLVMIAGQQPESSLAAFRARSSGPTPGVLAREGAPLVGGFDVGTLTSPASEATPVQGTYRATRDGDVVTARVHATVPARAMTVLRTILTARMEQQRRDRVAPPTATTPPSTAPARTEPARPQGTRR